MASIDDCYKKLWAAVIVQAINDYLANNRKGKNIYKITREQLERSMHDFYSDDSYVDGIMRAVDDLYCKGIVKIGGDLL